MDIANELKRIILKEDFLETERLLNNLFYEADAIKYVENLILLMEKNPNTDFGMPGPVVHFIEKFNETEYVDILIASLKRNPTNHTLWMLNRIINDSSSTNRTFYVQILYEISQREDVNLNTRKLAQEFYNYQKGGVC